MEAERFNAIVEEKAASLAALFSPLASTLGGETIFYNAYFNGTEVVVAGYRFAEGGHTYTKPVAILVDDEVFERLRVDDEAGRVDGMGEDCPKRVV